MNEKITSSTSKHGPHDFSIGGLHRTGLYSSTNPAFGGVPNNFPSGVGSSAAGGQQSQPIRPIRKIYPYDVGYKFTQPNGPELKTFHRFALRWPNCIGLGIILIIAIAIDMIAKYS
jgi:hypothetical protein